MSVRAPHFLLYSAADQAAEQGDWRFVLRAADGSQKIEVEDAEPDMHGERLELLAVVRGLEALDQPSRVTLVTPSKYVTRGLQHGLEEWRANEWQWERHGEMVPVKNHDLWQRIDRAMTFHRVECRTWRFDLPHAVRRSCSGEVPAEPCIVASPRAAGVVETRVRRQAHSLRHRRRRISFAVKRWLHEVVDAWRLRLSQCGSSLLPSPWLE